MRRERSFEELRQQKIKFSLRTRLTLLVGAEVLVSILIAFGLSRVTDWLLPDGWEIPTLVQMMVFSLAVAMIVTAFFSRVFFGPIKKVREGMQRVADGDLSTRLETRSSSVELQELIAGFNLMTCELRATEILQTDFVSNVSHEFKTPISAIEGYSTLLQGCESLNADQRDYVEKILLNTRRLSALVSNSLLLSKVENQALGTASVTFGLDEQVREAILSLEAAWEEREIELDVELEDVAYHGNEPMLYHVWTNLIGNAVKFSPRGGTVAVRLYTEEAAVVFTVADEGPGLSEEAMKHLFDKFYQADTSHKQEGNGLGLALVRRILLAAGGEVTAENRLSGGCRFTVRLPA